MKIEEKDVFISYHESIAEQVSDLNKKLNQCSFTRSN